NPPVSIYHGPLTINVDDPATHDAPGFVLWGDFVQTAPAADIRPLEGHRHHGCLLGFFHDPGVDRDRGQAPILLVNGGSRRVFLVHTSGPGGARRQTRV